MTRRPYEANVEQFALWHQKRVAMPFSARRVAIAHRDAAVADSLVLLLGLRGFAAQRAIELPALTSLLEKWHPQAVLIDTRFIAGPDQGYVKKLQESGTQRDTLLMAMSNFLPEDSPLSLQEAGFDGHCRRPCPMWRVSDILSDFFADTGY